MWEFPPTVCFFFFREQKARPRAEREAGRGVFQREKVKCDNHFREWGSEGSRPVEMVFSNHIRLFRRREGGGKGLALSQGVV